MMTIQFRLRTRKSVIIRPIRRRAAFMSGQGLTEFALLAPVAMIALFCVVQAGMMIYAYSFVSYAARMGARYAGVRGTQSGAPFNSDSVTTYVRGLSSGLNLANLSVTASGSPNQNPGSTATVVVTYNYQPIRPFSQTVIPLSSTAKTTISY
jgi:Flp pilus assembly protein TadG